MKKIFLITALIMLLVPVFATDFEINTQIPSGTVLVMNQSPFTEERFVFVSETSGVYQEFLVEFCKESAWGTSRFSKAKFIFFSDGKCKINDIDGTYTESNGIFCVSTLYLANFLYFFQNKNALYKGLAI